MVMLKGIPRILTPDLLRVLAQMGHGDEIVIADANFPSASIAKAGPELIRADGHGGVEILKAILQLLPLDMYVSAPASLMDPVEADKKKGLKTPIWDEYKAAMNASEGQTVGVQLIERFQFYEHAKKTFAVVATGETALYANIILKKGVLTN
ncbi:fucose mutarotase-like isoform X2 [Hydractinia symbiolongicarpus]|nr:fucose mutarotase-like isoform X2 [Hydractinia symbiolongicarpus]